MKNKVKENPIFQYPDDEAYIEQKQQQKGTDIAIKKIRLILFAVISLSLISAFIGCLLGQYQKVSDTIVTVSIILFIISILAAIFILKKSTYYLYFEAYQDRIEIKQVFYKAVHMQKSIIYYDDIIKASLWHKGKQFKILFKNDYNSYVKDYDKDGNEIPVSEYCANNVVFNVPKRSKLLGFLIYEAPKYFNMKDRSRKLKYRNMAKFYSKIEE